MIALGGRVEKSVGRSSARSSGPRIRLVIQGRLLAKASDQAASAVQLLPFSSLASVQARMRLTG